MIIHSYLGKLCSNLHYLLLAEVELLFSFVTYSEEAFSGKGAKIKISNRQTNSGPAQPNTVINQTHNFRDVTASGQTA